MGLHRTHRKKADRKEAAQTKLDNRIYKAKERVRRDARMMGELKARSLPYAPAVMSWLSRKLDKASSKITTDDVKSILARKP